MNPKTKFPRRDAIAVARELVAAIAPVCERILVAGSLRRRKSEVGDVEIVFIPKCQWVKEGLFDMKRVSLADEAILTLLSARIIRARQNVAGGLAWGQKNKLAVHVTSGIPVDLFATRPACWWNYIVCRTGGKDNNVDICMAAQRQGWKFEPYGPGFRCLDGRRPYHRSRSEEDVYEFIGKKYLQPWERK